MADVPIVAVVAMKMKYVIGPKLSLCASSAPIRVVSRASAARRVQRPCTHIFHERFENARLRVPSNMAVRSAPPVLCSSSASETYWLFMLLLRLSPSSE